MTLLTWNGYTGLYRFSYRIRESTKVSFFLSSCTSCVFNWASDTLRPQKLWRHPPRFESTIWLLLMNICRSKMNLCRQLLGDTVIVFSLSISPPFCCCPVFLSSYLWAQTAQRSTVCGSTAVHHAATERKEFFRMRTHFYMMKNHRKHQETSSSVSVSWVPHLRVAPRSQSLTASLTAQTGPVPVLPERGHLFSCTHMHTHIAPWR